jgi:hypothetical protein
MVEHIKHIIFEEKRPFKNSDFRRFEVDGKEYRMAIGTIRNEFWKLVKKGEIELDYKSDCAYYTIKGHRFSRPMTPYHAGALFTQSGGITRLGRQTPLYKWLKNLPVEDQSLHNIRCRFEASGIWSAFSDKYPNLVNSSSQDIQLKKSVFCNDIEVTPTIHHTDTVSIAVACSYRPIAVNINGIMDCIESLVRTEERMTSMLLVCTENNDTPSITIPSYRKWIGTMWHFGVDGIDTCKGPAFCVTFEEGISDIYTIYIKRMRDGRRRPRLDRQEYSDNPFVNIFMEKLYPGGRLA